jgi:menaquinone reductase, molybdopterin-binding-like subunit
MKIDRRHFLALGTGITAGLTLSPVPWKLMDDVAIWTQNWSWTPVPEDGRVSYARSVCTLCPGGCGIRVRKVGNRAVGIEGQKDHPINRGGLCPLGLAGLQFLYGPSRVKSPVKRVGKRGEGRWQQITWEEALAEVGKRLSDLRENHQPHTVACIAGSDRGSIPNLISRFMTVYGSPNFIRSATAADTLEQVIYLTQGQQGTAGVDLENADFILSFGCGILDGWGAPGRMFDLFGRMHQTVRIVQVEPRLSDTAACADQWIGINPGTEGALALGLAHVMIAENLYDRNFVEDFTFGFEDFAEASGQYHEGFKKMVIDRFPPGAVAEITGVPRQKIIALARAFGRAQRPVAISGRGRGSLPGGIDECLAVHSLNALAGNINQPGGVSVIPEVDYSKWPEVNIDQIAAEGMQHPRIDGAGSEDFPNTRYLLNRFPKMINAADTDTPVQALLVAGANPLYTLADTAAVQKAFDRIPFIVSFSSYLDETAMQADVILPNHTYLERYQDVPSPKGLTHSVIGLSKPVVKPLYDTRHIGDVVIQLAKGLGGFVEAAFPWNSYESFLKQVMRDDWDRLSKKGFIEMRNEIPEPLTYTFNTVSAKFEFYPTARNNPKGEDLHALPFFSPVPIEGDANKYPFLLIPYDSIRLAGGDIPDAPFVTKTVADTVLKHDLVFVEINPKTAKAAGMSEGDEAILTTPRGKARVKLHLFEGIMPGLLALPRGLGHTAYTPEWCLANKGVNVNALVASIEDPASGLDAAWGIRAGLRRA